MKMCLVAVSAVLLLAVACGSGKHAAIAAGRHFGFIHRTDSGTIAFDDAEFLSGKEAQKAAEAAGEVAPGEPVSNDYFIRNRDPKPVTLRLRKDVAVTVVRCPTSCNQ